MRKIRFKAQGGALFATLGLATVLGACSGSLSEESSGGPTDTRVGAQAQKPPKGSGSVPGTIAVLSSRADLISGGDALVEIRLDPSVSPDAVRVELNGSDITAAFARREDGRYLGLVQGMALGGNELVARWPGGGQRMTLTNHPIGGPIFSGPQIQPWTCLGTVDDAQCNRAPTIAYRYKSTAGSGFRAYDPANPPADVASTTTDEGKTVPFIVRVETGNLNRDEYRFAVLWDPAKASRPWTPPEGFNRKLVIYHGASCNTDYQTGSAPDVLDEQVLGKGYATMSHALNNSGHNCNLVVQAEAMLMTKERVVETLGDLRYTIGSGCSGGALAQQWVANAYPGLYQGITTGCSFADSWTSRVQYSDYMLMRAYFEDPTRWGLGVLWDPLAIEAALGHPNPANPITFTTVIPDNSDPTRPCNGVPPEQLYHPQNNPGGVRCSASDYWINIIGRRPAELWTDVERQLGYGFAGVPFDNTGVQYGLRGLIDGRLTPQQFIDLNVKLGGYDIDRNPIAARSQGDVFAIERIGRSGGANMANNLHETAIIDLRGPDPGAFHDVYRTYVVRARLEREHGHADNQVLWRGTVPLYGDTTFADESIYAMSRWLDAVVADTSDKPLARKIVENRPADVADRCTDGAGVDMPASYCDAIVTSYTSPRIEAGMPFTDDVLKCQLKPLLRSDYYPVFFTDAQWSRLQQIFPLGVCDYSKPGVGKQLTVPWLNYRAGPGGEPLGTPPQSRPL
ncbi:DUF6351 family protein [Caldimonas tepidiphila]|uniref:DUF6351 family protein n=1 Tax=Caldimonas tepidiphila TaxID=2315841 RepID=UPI000E5B56D6|nr:DUF6351 family protein [Caldimonas tepidiphila]